MNKILLTISFVLVSFLSLAQNKEIARNNNIWLFNLTKLPLTDKWGFENELHYRLAAWGSTKQQFLIRPSVSYQANDHITFHLGYAYIQNYPYDEQPLAIRIPESNAWAQVTINHKISSFGLSHRYRLEERWVGQITENGANSMVDGKLHGNRIRYRLTIRKDLPNGKNYITAFNEVWFKFGEHSGLNRFNQNWCYAGVGQKISAPLAFEIGYLWQVIEKADGIHHESNHTIQCSIQYKICKTNNK